VSTAVYPELSIELSLSVSDELDPDATAQVHWQDLAIAFGLNPGGCERPRAQLVDGIRTEARTLRTQARRAAAQSKPRDPVRRPVTLLDQARSPSKRSRLAA
jgi:hypothetical protein